MSIINENCDVQHVVFDPATGVVIIPAIDIPIFDFITDAELRAARLLK